MNEKEVLNLIGRTNELFEADINKHDKELKKIVSLSSFLVIGGAGSIGQAVVKEIFKRNPKKIHVVDINENNLTELVRDIRSSYGYIDGDFNTFALDIGSGNKICVVFAPPPVNVFNNDKSLEIPFTPKLDALGTYPVNCVSTSTPLPSKVIPNTSISA